MVMDIAAELQAVGGDAFIPLTAGGGGTAASTHYSINYSVGQTVMGHATSPSFGAHLGYWFGLIIEQFSAFLPNVIQ